MSIVGTSYIHGYQMRHKVMWFDGLVDSISISICVITSPMTWPCAECFQKCFGADNIIILSLNAVIPIIVMVWLSKVTRCLLRQIILKYQRILKFLEWMCHLFHRVKWKKHISWVAWNFSPFTRWNKWHNIIPYKYLNFLFIIYNFKRGRFFALNDVIYVRILRHTNDDVA